MNFPARFFIGAVITALVIMIGSGLYATHLRTYDLANALAACEKESIETFPPGAPGEPTAHLVCDPETMVSLRRQGASDPPGAPGQVLKTYQSIILAKTLGFTLAFWALLIGAVPAVWYFFLARCSEIAVAFRGR